MNVEYTTKDGKNGRYTGVSYFQMGGDGVAFFNDDDLGFVQPDTLVTYAGPGHTGDIPAANDQALDNVMADLREREQRTDGIMIVGSSAHAKQDSSETKGMDRFSNGEDRNHRR